MIQFRWHSLNNEQLAQQLSTDLQQGLGKSEIKQRLAEYGLNQFEESKGRLIWHVFVDQFRDFMIMVLLTIALQLAVIYVPALNSIFNTQALSMLELAVCFLLPLIVIVVVEIEKRLRREKGRV